MSHVDPGKAPTRGRRRFLFWLIPAILVLAVAAYIIYPLIPSAADRRREAARKKIEELGWTVLVSGDVCTITGKAELGNDDLRKLIDAANEWNEVELDLGGTKIDADGLKYLEGLDLKQLDLTGLQLRDDSLSNLEGQSRLQQLHLGRTGLGDDTLRPLASFRSLRRLFLDDNPGIKGPGLVHLAKLDELRDLRLKATGVDDAGLRHLYGLKKLEKLYLKGATGVTQQGIKDLKTALPGLRVDIEQTE